MRSESRSERKVGAASDCDSATLRLCELRASARPSTASSLLLLCLPPLPLSATFTPTSSATAPSRCLCLAVLRRSACVHSGCHAPARPTRNCFLTIAVLSGAIFIVIFRAPLLPRPQSPLTNLLLLAQLIATNHLPHLRLHLLPLVRLSPPPRNHLDRRQRCRRPINSVPLSNTVSIKYSAPTPPPTSPSSSHPHPSAPHSSHCTPSGSNCRAYGSRPRMCG